MKGGIKMDGGDVFTGTYIVLCIISLIASIFCAQYIANYTGATGIMWWVFAILGYIVSGFILGLISLGISIGLGLLFE
jgi:hypothetical protein